MKDEEIRWREPRWPHKIARVLLAGLLRFLFRVYGSWKVIGLENIPRTGPVIFAANHASYIDPLLGWAAVYGYRQMWGVARSNLWKNRVIAFLMVAIGAIPVRRNTADRAMLRTVLDLLARGETVGLFPEGTRTEDGQLNRAQPGIALIAQKSGAPIVPVGIIGTYEMLPRNRKSLRRVPLTLAVGKPIMFPSDASREEVTTRVMEAIAALLTENGRPTEPPSEDRLVMVETG